MVNARELAKVDQSLSKPDSATLVQKRNIPERLQGLEKINADKDKNDMLRKIMMMLKLML